MQEIIWKWNSNLAILINNSFEIIAKLNTWIKMNLYNNSLSLLVSYIPRAFIYISSNTCLTWASNSTLLSILTGTPQPQHELWKSPMLQIYFKLSYGYNQEFYCNQGLINSQSQLHNHTYNKHTYIIHTY